jgi:hypothetical protein
MWAAQGAVENEALLRTIKSFAKETDKFLEAAANGDPFEFNSSTSEIEEGMGVEARDKMYWMPPEQMVDFMVYPGNAVAGCIHRMVTDSIDGKGIPTPFFHLINIYAGGPRSVPPAPPSST